MSTFQIVMLAGAAALAVSIFWPQILEFAHQLLERPDTPIITPAPLPPPTPAPVPDELLHLQATELVAIIACWETLKINCIKAGMGEAAVELNKIFPLFALGKSKIKTKDYPLDFISLTDGEVKNV